MKALAVLPLLLGAAAAAVVVLIARHAAEPAGDSSAPLAVATALAEHEQLFGSRLTATVRVAGARVDPAGVRVRAAFAPFRVLARSEAVRDGTLTVSYELQCLTTACAPDAPERSFAFPPVRVQYADRVRTAPWPDLVVASRLGPLGPDGATLVAPDPASRSYRLPPRLLGCAFAALAAVLLLAATALAARQLARLLARDSMPSPLERALTAAFRSSSRPVAERRAALDGLAVQLERLGSSRLAAATRRLAWSPPAPERDAIDELVSSVREQVPA